MSNLPSDSNVITKTNGAVQLHFNKDKTIDVYVRRNDAEGSFIKVPQTEEEFDELPEPEIPEPVIEPPSQALLDLLTRAIDDPASLTEEEKLEVLDWKPLERIDKETLDQCGLTWQDVVMKAVDNPAELTRDEAHQVVYGRRVPDDPNDAFSLRTTGIFRQPEPTKQKWLNARDAAKDAQYILAEKNAIKELNQHENQRDDAIRQLSYDERRNITYAKGFPSFQNLASDPNPHWGFVCIRTSYENDDEWKKYKNHLQHSALAGLWCCSTKDMVSRKWKIEFIESDGAHLDSVSAENARKYFKNAGPESQIAAALKSGLRDDIFLLGDTASISSMHDAPYDPWDDHWTPAPDTPPRKMGHLIPGFAKAVDASYDPAKQYEHGFDGVLKVHPAHVATDFFHRMKKRDEVPPPESGRWWPYKQSIETMYAKAHGRGKRLGNVYPPHSQWNKRD